MAKFQKDDTRINKSGRPKGSPNRLTRELREALKHVIAGEIEALPERLEQLENKERVDAVIKLMQYTLPKLDTLHPKDGEPVDMDLNTW